MILHDGRYRDLDPNLFDLIVWDEAHHFFGPKMRQIPEHFNSFQVHMTATPENCNNHLNEFVPHRFFEPEGRQAGMAPDEQRQRAVDTAKG